MDRTRLKYLAAALMLMDHAAVLFPLPDLLFYLFRFLGRLAFPVFAWMAAEGLHRTGSRKKYLTRLGVFALVSELPFLACFGYLGEWLSVLATFLLAGLAMTAYERLRESTPLATALLPLLGAMAAAELLRADYGAGGVLLVAALYLMEGHKKHQLWFLAGWCLFTYLVVYPLPALLAMLPAGLMTPDLETVAAVFLREVVPTALGFTAFALLSVPLLKAYTGEPGTGHKWFFYWFYPVHLALLAVLSWLYYLLGMPV